MSKGNTNIKNKVIYWITCHPWLKLISLILAILVWLYIGRELEQFNY